MTPVPVLYFTVLGGREQGEGPSCSYVRPGSPIFVLDPAVIVNKNSLEQIPGRVIRVLVTYAEDVEVAEAGCAVLWLLSLLGEQFGALEMGRMTLDT